MESDLLEDYLARLNIEEDRGVWLGNHSKIEYVLNKSRKYLKPGMSACEIGIGDGYLLRLLSSFRLEPTGIDISSYLVEKLGKVFDDDGLEISLLQHDMSQPIDYENAFTAVFCLDSLEHIEDLGKAIASIKRMLKPGGILVATLPLKENFTRNLVMCPKCHHKFHRVGHFHYFNSYADIVNMLGGTGSLRILKFGIIPGRGLPSIIIDLLKKTVFRRKRYTDGLPNTENTCFFIAQFDKRLESVV